MSPPPRPISVGRELDIAQSFRPMAVPREVAVPRAKIRNTRAAARRWYTIASLTLTALQETPRPYIRRMIKLWPGQRCFADLATPERRAFLNGASMGRAGHTDRQRRSRGAGDIPCCCECNEIVTAAPTAPGPLCPGLGGKDRAGPGNTFLPERRFPA